MKFGINLLTIKKGQEPIKINLITKKTANAFPIKLKKWFRKILANNTYNKL